MRDCRYLVKVTERGTGRDCYVTQRWPEHNLVPTALRKEALKFNSKADAERVRERVRKKGTIARINYVYSSPRDLRRNFYSDVSWYP